VIGLPETSAVIANGTKVNAARPEHGDELMTITFSLAIPQAKHDELEAMVAKGQVVSTDELKTKYAVDAAEVEPLVAWLKSAGYEILHVSDDRTSVRARAKVRQIEQSLGVTMVRVTKNGVTYTAARNVPSLPAEIAKSVHAIGGLQPFRHAHKHLREVAPKNRHLSAPSPNIANSPPYLVQEILKAYDADGIDATGSGQTIAILIDTFPSDSDLVAFWERNGVRNSLSHITKINVSGGALPTPEGEETLDAEWASGIAPGANVRIYASGSLSFIDLDLALDRILSDLASEPGMRQLSISLGLGETFMVPAEVRSEHQRFLRLAAAGVNVFVSSGDAGSNPDSTGHAPDGPLQAEFASSDPCVVGVGGTSLVLAPDGSVASETGWSDGGGGRSIFFNRPPWQTGAGVPNGDSRFVPDVSLAADPSDGAFLILNGRPKQIGGTSWSAPVWAGFCALINEARASARKPPLGFLNPLIYPLLGSNCFRDIDSGSNGAFHAGPGYDLVTGVGVPSVKNLINKL
jgi:kumamolisin